MATIISTPTTVSINSQGTSAIGALAASMPAGTWARVSPANDQNVFLGVGGISGSMLHYANNCAWNTHNKCIEIVGADHNYGTPGTDWSMRYVRFDTGSNAFVLVNVGGDNSDSGTGPGHEFSGLALNPSTGDSYYRHYGTVGLAPFLVTKAVLNARAFSSSVPASPITVQNVTCGTCWWSGSFAGAGAQGCLVIFSPGNSQIGGSASDGHVMAYDPIANSWFFSKSGMSPFYGVTGKTTGSTASYSAVKNCMLYGGGYDNPRKVWRLNFDNSYTVMPDVPSGKEMGTQSGNVVTDPVSGNFLLLSNNELWEFNPSGSGTWTQQTGSRVPPAGYRPGPYSSGAVDGVVSCSIPEYSVIAYIKQTSPMNSSFYLYKHA